MNLNCEDLTAAGLLLGLVALLPPLLAFALGFFPTKHPDEARIQTGIPLAPTSHAGFNHVALRPILHLTRTAAAGELRDLATGLRHLPVERSAVPLQHLARSADPEVSLYAQSVLQLGRERLQALFTRLQNHPQRSDPRIAASWLETGLRLASPSLETNGERNRWVSHLAKLTEECLAGCEHSPRLIAVCAQIFLTARQPDKAATVAQLLPANSPLRSSIERAAGFAIHTGKCGLAIGPE